MSAVLAAFGVVAIMIVVVTAIGLGVYHFFVFPNVDAVAQDIRWYNYDDESQHYLYWFWFWLIVLFGGLLASAKANVKE